MNLERSHGVLLHPTSLPSGRLDDDAYAFVDWLAEAGQSWWQVLPLGPPDKYGSPYKALSAFACSADLLAEPDARVSGAEEDAFRSHHASWIGDWEAFAGDGAVADQVRFDREWGALRAYAAERGVRIMGDVPIYIAPGSADHIRYPGLFQDGEVAGAPPDKFTQEGQLWGNPLYDWGSLRRNGFVWWTERFRRTFDLFDLTRIDHFRGFVAYWSVPEDAADARSGRWRRGPGRDPFDAAAAALGELPLVAEDLGVITPPVHRLRDELGLPGMVVLQFGYDPDDRSSPHRVSRHVEHRITYTGTHDHDTIAGWYGSAGDAVHDAVGKDLRERGIRDDGDMAAALVRLNASSAARIAIVPAQDVLGLGSQARTNVPGSKGKSWKWKLEEGQLGRQEAQRLHAAALEWGRLPTKP